MRHIPDDELHAYLDQALSRSQAIEIERHLARCPDCQERRDGTAALRDRTTALLAQLGSPPAIIPPPFGELRARQQRAHTRRVGRLRSAAIAAGLVAVGIGGFVLGRPTGSGPSRAASAPSLAAPTAAPLAHLAPSRVPQVLTPRSPGAGPATPSGRHAPQLVRVASRAEEPGFAVARAEETDPQVFFTASATPPLPSQDPPATEVQDVDVRAMPVTAEPGLAGLWRTVPLDGADPAAAGLPIVPGLAVVRLRMQPGATGAEVVAVDQQLESGEIVRTIVGPAGRVGDIVARDAAADSTSGRVTFTIRQADRMVAVSGPAEAVTSFLSRVNGRRRY